MYNPFKKVSYLPNVIFLLVCFMPWQAHAANDVCPPGEISNPQLETCVLDPLTVQKYVDPLPILRRLDARTGGKFDIELQQIEQNLLGPGFPDTTVWGYGENKWSITYPGPTFVAKKDVPVEVFWKNKLPKGEHLLSVDLTIHTADPIRKALEKGYIPTVTHLHGGHTEFASDGIPEAWFTQGFSEKGAQWAKGIYRYDNDQQAATLWYHDNALGLTRLNVYAGLAGFYLLRDDNENHLTTTGVFPRAPYEIEMIVQDKIFTSDGKLFLPSQPKIEVPAQPFTGGPSIIAEFFGNVILVNGKAWPMLDVEPRKYRFRLLNGSDFRFYIFEFANQMSFLQIGSDEGLLKEAVQLNQLLLAPGERADLVVDFSQMSFGSEVILKNLGPDEPYGGGTPGRDFAPADPDTTGQIMKFAVNTQLSSTPEATVAQHTPLNVISSLQKNGSTRQLLLFEGLDEFGRLQPLLGTVEQGTKTWFEPASENTRLNDTEIWEFYNTTADAYPIHLHLVAFQIVDRQRFTGQVTERPQAQYDSSYGVGGQLSKIKLKGKARGPEENEKGWKDTVVALPGEVTRVVAKFDREGRYIWSCQILSHEDHEMMRPFTVEGPR